MAQTNLVSFSLIDDDGTTKSMPVYFDSSESVASIITTASDIATALDALSGAAITGISMTLSVAIPVGLKTAPVANIEAVRGALLGFNVDESNYRHSIFVPGAIEAAFTGRVVNLANVQVSNFVSVVGGGATTNPEGLDLQGVISGIKSFRRK